MKKLALLVVPLLAMLMLAPLLIALIVAGIIAPAVVSTIACGQDAPVTATGDWRPPFQQRYTLTSPFGRRYHPIYKQWRLHTGQDLASLPGAGPVVAASSGTVISARTEPVVRQHRHPPPQRRHPHPLRASGQHRRQDPTRCHGHYRPETRSRRIHRHQHRAASAFPGRDQRPTGRPGAVHGRPRRTARRHSRRTQP